VRRSLISFGVPPWSRQAGFKHLIPHLSMIGCKPMKEIGLTVSVSQSHAVDRVGLLMAYGISSTAKKNSITDSNYIGRLHLSLAVRIAGKGLPL